MIKLNGHPIGLAKAALESGFAMSRIGRFPENDIGAPLYLFGDPPLAK